jgi:CheY-like chemotaxis protein
VARSDGLGTGSELEIRLPTPAKVAAGQVVRATWANVTTSTKRILVVDDNVDSAEMLRELLQAAGHEVALAHDGLAALALVDRFAPEVALLDIGLPVMDGYELGKRLHDSAGAPRCRLIALTGYGQDHDRAQSKRAGFEAHLVKPFDPDRLLQIIGSR